MHIFPEGILDAHYRIRIKCNLVVCIKTLVLMWLRLFFRLPAPPGGNPLPITPTFTLSKLCKKMCIKHNPGSNLEGILKNHDFDHQKLAIRKKSTIFGIFSPKFYHQLSTPRTPRKINLEVIHYLKLPISPCQSCAKKFASSITQRPI